MPDSCAIRWRSQCDQSHVELQDTTTGETLGARFHPFSASRDGIQIRPAKENNHQRRVILATYSGIEDTWKWMAANRIGTRYNWKGILGIATAEDWNDPTHRDCSQAQYEGALYGANLLLLNCQSITPWKITPRDLLLSKEIKLL